MAGSDLKRIRRLGRYLGQDRRRLLLTLALLVPLAFSVAVQPLLIGQAISILRTVAGATNEAVVPFLQPLDSTLALRLIIAALLIAVLLRFVPSEGSALQQSVPGSATHGQDPPGPVLPCDGSVPQVSRPHAGGKAADASHQRCGCSC